MVEGGERLGALIVEYCDVPGAATVVASVRELARVEVIVISTGPEPFPSSVGIRVVHLPSNPGFGAALNRGVRSFSPEVSHVLVSNTDIKCTAAGVRKLWDVARRTGAAMVAPTILEPGGRVEWDGGHIDFIRLKVVHERIGEPPREASASVPTMFVTGAHFVAARAAWEAAGGMREDFFLYGEDADFSMRVRRAGLTSLVHTGVRVVHESSGSAGRDSPLQLYLMSRNNVRFFREWSPTAWGRLLCWWAVPARLLLQRLGRGTRVLALLPWVVRGAWDARSSSRYCLMQGRAGALLASERSRL